MAKVTLSGLGDLQDTTTAANVINNNTNAINTAFQNTLSRDGSTPNTMSVDIDMNSHTLLNLTDAATAGSPITLRQFNATSIPSGNLPLAGVAGDTLIKNSSASYDASWGKINTASITNNAVTNATLAQMPTNTLKGNNTGSTANATDLTAAQVTTLLHTGMLAAKITGVNFNGANTDTPLTIFLPTGTTRWALNGLSISNASASISTATGGMFTGTGGTGQVLAANQALTVTTAAANTNNNAQFLTGTNTATETYDVTTVQFRVGTAQGSPATADVTLHYRPV